MMPSCGREWVYEAWIRIAIRKYIYMDLIVYGVAQKVSHYYESLNRIKTRH